ncbi:uncharacterized protein BDV17DRAFT_215919 [Aspergillus undulatus]|uniref:uncharacterized protein n=1 Tax=Aspergillus undulatus TaxID=1810928 RepID=UPI003CCE4078
MDPLQRMFLTTTYEALEMAGYNPDSSTIDKSKISTYFGQSTDDWRTINEQQGIQSHYLPCTNRSFAAGRVSHHFKWGGGYYSIDTGCSSSATAIHLASSALLAGESDMCVVGGGNICVIPEYFSGFSLGSFLSPTGGCKTFSDRADGYCRGEAIGTVIIKRLGDALAANDNILGVVAATARNTNAGEDSITYPGEIAQGKLLEQILTKAGVSGNEIGFVEMHGTGTEAGDSVEMSSVRNVLARFRPKHSPLHVGALKANIGHGEAAAGISSLIKALLMLRHDAIPGQPGPFALNNRFAVFDTAGVYIAMERLSPIPRYSRDGKRKIIVNSFDAAGGNTSILLQDGPARAEKHPDPRTHYLITVSAKSTKTLSWKRDNLRRHLEEHQTSLADLSYTTTARRIHHAHREVYVMNSIEQLITRLKEPPQPPSQHEPSSIAFVFTGQSSQYTAMGATLYSTSPRFRKMLDTYDSHCRSIGLDSFIDVIRGDTDISSATQSQVQLAIVALEIALANFLQDLGLKPAVALGHSLGEYSALCIAGVLSVSNVLYLVHKRAKLLEEHCEVGAWGMMAVSLGAEAIESLLQEVDSSCELCCLNGPSNTVIGGPSNMLERLETVLTQKSLTSSRLKLPYAFHTSQMDCILPELREIANGIHFGKPSIPIVSTLTGRVVTTRGTLNSSYLVQQCRQWVDFVGALKTCEAEGLIANGSMVIEIGPHPLCTGLLALCLPDSRLTAVPTLKRGRPDWETISKCLAAAYMQHQPVDWEAVHSDYSDCLSLVPDLPSYAFDSNEYWTPYKRQIHGQESKPQNSSTPSTMSLQTIESINPDKSAATFTSRVREPFLLKAIQGHLVDGAAICPASLFLDMAVGAALALRQPHAPKSRSTPIAIDIEELEMANPLVVSKSDVEQIIRVQAHASAEGNGGSRRVHVKTSSSTRGTEASTTHARCVVVLHDQSRPSPSHPSSIWPQVQRLIQQRVKALSSTMGTESSHKMAKPLLYKLFDSIVEYSAPYRVLENIAVDLDFQDAVAEICVPAGTGTEHEHGVFSLDPFTIDALIHLPGFLLNCNFDKPKGTMYIAKSVGRVLVLDPFLNTGGRGERRLQLTCYAAITEPGTGNDGVTLCDAYLFSPRDGELVALVEGICFQRINRRTFNVITGGSEAMILPSQPTGVPSPNATANKPILDKEDLYSVLLRTVAGETGTDLEDVESAVSFTALGVDSHMGIAIIAEVNRATGALLPAAFFNNFPTLANAERELRGRGEKGLHTLAVGCDGSDSGPPNGSSSPTPTPTMTLASTSGSSNIPLPQIENHSIGKDLNQERDHGHGPTSEPIPSSSILTGKAILLQGDPTSPKAPLFLVPESTGSVTVYIYYPPLPNGQPIYGIESPFLTCPEKNTLSVPDLAKLYIATMRTVQPNGPYLLGGYSFAAIYAYEMAYQLCVHGEGVLGLLIIDMHVPPPCPPISAEERGMEREIELGMQRFSSHIFGDGPLVRIFNRLNALFLHWTDEQKAHMAGSLRGAATYTPLPIPAGHGPVQTHIIWAGRGLNENGNPDEFDEEVQGHAWMGACEPDRPWNELSEGERVLLLRSWFSAPRRTFGSNGWEELVPGGTQTHRVDADHCSLVLPPRVQKLGEVLALVVGSCTERGSMRSEWREQEDGERHD